VSQEVYQPFFEACTRRAALAPEQRPPLDHLTEWETAVPLHQLVRPPAVICRDCLISSDRSR
jgi:hypothetical protein